MTTLVLHLRCQILRTMRGPRRLTWIVVVLALIAMLGMWTVLEYTPQLLRYPSRYITPTPVAACPGEEFKFPVSIRIEQGDTTARVTESWQREDGIQPQKYQSAPQYLNFLEPFKVSRPGTRAIPDDMPPGIWKLVHCNETHADGLMDVNCYGVQIEVLDCSGG